MGTLSKEIGNCQLFPLPASFTTTLGTGKDGDCLRSLEKEIQQICKRNTNELISSTKHLEQNVWQTDSKLNQIKPGTSAPYLEFEMSQEKGETS